MSADNGIYIGEFPIQDEQSQGSTAYEYRVIHAQAIDNLYFFPNEELEKKFKGENPRSIVEYFGEAEVLTEKQAHDKAFEMEAEILNDDFCPILEYGICTLRFKKMFAWYKNHAHEIVYKWDKENK